MPLDLYLQEILQERAHACYALFNCHHHSFEPIKDKFSVSKSD